jgi:hypothetical protein
MNTNPFRPRLGAISPSCGPAHGGAPVPAPYLYPGPAKNAELCSVGTPRQGRTTDALFSWQCGPADNDPANAKCQRPRLTTAPACGPADGAAPVPAPYLYPGPAKNADLCSVGTPRQGRTTDALFSWQCGYADNDPANAKCRRKRLLQPAQSKPAALPMAPQIAASSPSASGQKDAGVPLLASLPGWAPFAAGGVLLVLIATGGKKR